jgi:ferredoxin
MLQISYYRNKCIGCATCVEAAPHRWRMSKKDGKANLVQSTEKKGIQHLKVGLEELAENRLAATNCPVRIIKLNVI